MCFDFLGKNGLEFIIFFVSHREFTSEIIHDIKGNYLRILKSTI